MSSRDTANLLTDWIAIQNDEKDEKDESTGTQPSNFSDRTNPIKTALQKSPFLVDKL